MFAEQVKQQRVLVFILVVFLLQGCGGNIKSELIKEPGPKPWTNLNFNSPVLQFAVVADRTTKARGDVFERAIGKVQLMEPDFVMCVGDFVQGYRQSDQELRGDWAHVRQCISSLTMPFFYVPGNHDWHNQMTKKAWNDNFGHDYYHFVYKNVLFLVVNTADGTKEKPVDMSDEQLQYFEKILNSNKDVLWTFVFTHKPAWRDGFDCSGNWKSLQKLLSKRNHTMFAGHTHTYNKMVLNDKNYYTLATTGGASLLKGPAFGQLDLITWVTLQPSGPVITHIQPDSIFNDELKN